ncbi:hypothetical protein PV325_009369 [Microctonus aethiopoides]|nr:hypothetical protein PV325_009369 [Microctonus aethiopoides]
MDVMPWIRGGLASKSKIKTKPTKWKARPRFFVHWVHSPGVVSGAAQANRRLVWQIRLGIVVHICRTLCMGVNGVSPFGLLRVNHSRHNDDGKPTPGYAASSPS